VIVDGAYALHARLHSLLDIHVVMKAYRAITSLCTGVPRLNTLPPLASISLITHKEPLLVTPKPLRIRSDLVNRDDDISQPWTRSPTKSKMDQS
ncbi:hypothetical protein Tco_0880967, partial [Tanacetum coccineum]